LSAEQLRHAADLKEKIADLQNELAKFLGGSIAPAAPAAPAGKRKISAAGRARIIAAQKARWAKVKSAKPSLNSRRTKRTMSPAAKAKIAAAARARWAKAKAAGKKSL
jgi:hypothetical protein